MTPRPLQLARSKRSLLGAAALLCYAAAIVLEPSNVRSQLGHAEQRPPLPAQAHADLLPAPIVPAGDAFAPRATVDDDPRPAAPASAAALPPLPRLVAAPPAPVRPPPATRVTAIATGTAPTAVIDSGGTPRVVGVGDALDDSTIERIDEDGLDLANGRRLLLEPVSGR